MKDNHSVRGLEVLCAAINAAVGLEREERKAALNGVSLSPGCHSILLRYDGSDATAGYRHSPAKTAGLNAASVAQLMSLCRLSSVRPAEVSDAERGMLILLGTPSPLALAKEAGRG
jgi:hypothetical protein